MVILESSRVVDAAPEAVFGTVSNGENYGRVIPNIATIEFVTAHKTGLGAKFRETRDLPGWRGVVARLLSIELTVNETVEYVENERVDLVADCVGADWHSVFSVSPVDGGRRTRLSLRLETRPHGLWGRLMPALLAVPTRQGMNADLDAVQAHYDAKAKEAS